MHIVTLVLSIFALCLCWLPFWSIPVAAVALIFGMVMFYNYYLSPEKEEFTKGRGMVFAAFVLSILAVIGAMIMAGIPTGLFLILGNE